jgi:hypothetical protein
MQYATSFKALHLILAQMGINPPHAQDAAALGCSGFAAPEQGGPCQRPDSKRGPSDEAGVEQLTASQMQVDALGCFRYPQGDPSLVQRLRRLC